MANVNLNLAQPPGTAIPAPLTVLEGGFEFDNSGLSGTNADRNVVQFADAAEGEFNFVFQDEGSATPDAPAIEFRYQDNDNRMTLAWKPSDGRLIYQRRVGGTADIRKDEVTSSIGANSSITIKIVLVSNIIRIFLDGVLWYEEAHNDLLGATLMRVRLMNVNSRMTSLSYLTEADFVTTQNDPFNLDLALPQGTALPQPLIIFEGDADFDGSGLSGTTSGRNVVQFADRAEGLFTFRLQDTGTNTTEAIVIEWRWLNDNNRMSLAWKPSDGRLIYQRKQNGTNDVRNDQITASIGASSFIDIQLLLVGTNIKIKANDALWFEDDHSILINETQMRVRMGGTGTRLVSIAYDDANEFPVDPNGPLQPYDLDLAQPEGTPLPDQLSLVDGGVVFDSSGLSGVTSGSNTVQYADVAEGDFEIVLQDEGSATTSAPAIEFRWLNDDNRMTLAWIPNTGQVIYRRKEGGINDTRKDEIVAASAGANSTLTVRLVLSGNNVEIYLNGTIWYTESHNILIDETISRVRLEGTATRITSISYAEVVVLTPPLNLPLSQPGFRRSVVSRTPMFNLPANFPSGDFEEYFGQAIRTEGIPNWPSTDYPLLLATSPDHSDTTGGIFIRVFKPSESAFTNPHQQLKDPNAWFEWGEVSNLPEFDHITQKTNPIFTANNDQCETPRLYVLNGTVYMYWHQRSGLGIPSDPQGSRYATSTNGIDYSNAQAVTASFAYDPNFRVGIGHTGYFDFGDSPFEQLINPITSSPYTFIGKCHSGGGNNFNEQIVASDDLESWDVIAFYRRRNSELQKYNLPGEGTYVYQGNQVFTAIKEGAYYRITLTYKTDTIGGNDIDGGICEVLVDKDFYPVSEPNFFLLPRSGEFDALESSNLKEFWWHGKRYGFYKGMQDLTGQADESLMGLAEIADVPHTWQIFDPRSQKTVDLSIVSNGSTPASGITYSQTATAAIQEGVPFTRIVLPQNEAYSTALVNHDINLLAHDFTDIRFEGIGKDNPEPIELEFGVADSVTSATRQVSVFWAARTASLSTAQSQEMVLAKVGTGTDGLLSEVGEFFGQSTNWQNLGNDESVYAKHDITLRFIPAENKVLVLSGVSIISEHLINGFDYQAVLNPYIKARFVGTEQTADGSVAFSKISVTTYQADAITLPAAPTINASSTGNSITLTAGTVAGATGYKYFLDGLEQDSGTFTGLTPSTEYSAWVRAIGALGDSLPSTIISVTTSALPNNPPTISISGDTTAAAGETVTLTATVTDLDVNDIQTITWEKVSGSGTLSGTTGTSITVTGTTDIASEDTVIRARTNDGIVDSAFATHTITFSAVLDPSSNSILAVNLFGLPNGNHKLHIINLNTDTLVTRTVTFLDGTGSVFLNFPSGTPCSYSNVTLSTPIKAGLNSGVTQ